MTNFLLPNTQKMLQFKNSEILHLTRSQAKLCSKCSVCISVKFPFNLTDNEELIRQIFDWNYNWKCQATSQYEAGDSKYIFQFERNDPSTDRTFSALIDGNDAFLRKSLLQSNFKLYQNHTFHKLVNRLSETKFISLFHTNICSLPGNFDNLQHLIYNWK